MGPSIVSVQRFESRDAWEREYRRMGRWWWLIWHREMSAVDLLSGWWARQRCRLTGHIWDPQWEHYDEIGSQCLYDFCDRCWKTRPHDGE